MAIHKEKCLVVDIDGTLCPVKAKSQTYAQLKPYNAMVARLRALKEQGFHIILQSSRNMKTYDGNLGEINAHTLPVLIEWLARYDIPYDEIHMGKPWAGKVGFYVDDRAVRPDEFLENDIDALEEIIERGRNALADK